jgi:hypothetical protein
LKKIQSSQLYELSQQSAVSQSAVALYQHTNTHSPMPKTPTGRSGAWNFA